MATMRFARRGKQLGSIRHCLMVCLFSIVIAAMLCWSIWIVIAANRTWTGGTPGDPSCASPNPLWTNACNWTSKVLPVPGDDLTFGSSFQASSTNSFANGTTFNSISISAGHIMVGNSVSLNAGLIANNGQISLSSIKLNNDQTFMASTAGTGALITSVIDNNGKTLTLDGPGNFALTGIVTGSGRLKKLGSGLTLLAANNNYTGQTLVFEGTLLVSGSQPQSDVALLPDIGRVATLGGSGTVGPIIFSIQGFPEISPGGANNGTGILTTNGNVSAIPNADISFDLNNATAGSGYDQLKVNGTVFLNNMSIGVNLGFTPPAGTSFTIIDNDGTDATTGEFANHPEGSSFTANNTTFFITYKGGDGNDVALHVPETKTWNGGGANNNWTTGANWQGGSAPQPGDMLQFPATAARKTNVNEFPAGTPFSQFILSGGGYSISGNSVKLLGNLSNTATSGATNFFSLDISGPGGIAHNANTLVLSGNNTITGTTNLTNGVLAINGSQASSPVVITGGTLRGIGTTGPVSATGGSITPGDSGGQVLSISGALTLNSNVTYRPTFVTDPTGQFLRLSVNGALNLASSSLDVSDLSSLPGPGEAFKIIDKTNSGPVQGTFAGKPEGALFTFTNFKGTVRYRISYVGGDGNDVTLTSTTARTWSGGGTTNNWTDAANWVGGVAPAAGDSLVFPSGAARLTPFNNFPAGTTFDSITFSATGYSLSGNLVGLIGGITRIDSGTSGNVITMPIRLDGLATVLTPSNQIFSTPAGTNLLLGNIDTNGNDAITRQLTVSGGGRFNLSGTITGGGVLIFNGSGLSQVTSASPNLLSGSTVIHSGSVQLIAAQPNSRLFITGGEFFGNAVVQSIMATGGIIHPQFGGATSSTGNVSLGPGVVFDTAVLRDAATAAASTFVVGGDLNLGNARLSLTSNFVIAPTIGDAFKIIDKTGAGPIQGTFKDLPEGATLLIKGYPFGISYAGGDGNDVVLTALPPLLLLEEGTANQILALDSVTFMRSPFRILSDNNFSADHHTRVILFTSNLELTQPNPSLLTVHAAPAFPPEFNLEIENVGRLTSAANGIDGSFIVVRLPDSLPPGDYQISFTLRGVRSNSGVLSVSP